MGPVSGGTSTLQELEKLWEKSLCVIVIILNIFQSFKNKSVLEGSDKRNKGGK